MSNKQEREYKEGKNLFGDPKFARDAWRSVGMAILQSPASSKTESLDKDGCPTVDTQIESYGYASLSRDIATLQKEDREPTELEMILRCQAIHARHNPASATFIRDTVGAKPVDESKQEVTNVNPYEELSDEELEALAAFRASKSGAQQATPEHHIAGEDSTHDNNG